MAFVFIKAYIILKKKTSENNGKKWDQEKNDEFSEKFQFKKMK